MREVSCKVYFPFLRELREKGVDPGFLVEGTGISVQHLADPDERVDWSDHVRIFRNGRQLWNDDDFVRIGADIRGPLRWVVGMASVLFSTSALFRWMTGAARQHVFSCIRSTFEELTPGQLRMTLKIEDGYEPCREVFLLSKGGMGVFPTLLGGAQAKIELIENGAEATFLVTLGDETRPWQRLKRFVVRALAPYVAARELEKAHGFLEQRYAQLSAAQQTIGLQATKLETAARITSLIRANLDLDLTLQQVCQAVTEVGKFRGASVSIDVISEGTPVQRQAASGDRSGRELCVSLEGRGHRLGQLRVALAPDDREPERQELLEFVAPAIAMTIDDAITVTLLREYRRTLEERVKERTLELTKARDDLTATVNELRASEAARERIVANVNHEIRTPLSLALLAIRNLQTRMAETLGEMERKDLRTIEAAVRRLLRLIDELLILSSIGEGKLALRMVRCDVAQLARQVVEEWSSAATARGLRLSYEGPQTRTATLDNDALDRILTNLVSNALKFTPHGGAVVVCVLAGEGDLRVSVKDTGVGIDPEFRKRIFGRFQQGRPAVHAGAQGSGIGLAIVKELVERHGGKVEVLDVASGGTEFVMNIPRQAAVEARAVPGRILQPQDFGISSSPDESVQVLSPRGTPEAVILVAEDDPDLRRSVGILLLQNNFRVLLAPDGKAALLLAAAQAPHLLISDLEMPNMDGLELTRRFRAMPSNRLAPVLLLTAYGTPRKRLEGFEAGAVDFVSKPFDPEELIARVRAQLQLRSLALRLHESEKLAMIGSLSSGLAHEIRNPANAIVNAVGPLRERMPAGLMEANAGVRDLFQVLETCADQIAALSRQLLGFRGDGQLECESIKWGTLVSRTLAILGPVMQRVTVRQVGRFDGHLWCSETLIIQALGNILENAAHAAGQGGWVEISSERADYELVIEVKDSGPGVPPELRERIFEPFFTTKDLGKGTGLGLPTAREIARRHGGVLELRESREGSVFRFQIPIRLGQAGADSIAAGI